MEQQGRLDAKRGAIPAILPGALLALAASIVGVAIALDGALSRTVNGVGVVCWIAAGALIARSLRGAAGRFRGASATAAAVVVLAVVVRPSDLPAAFAGFSIAGAVIASIVRDRPMQWVLLLPAAWLPAHVALAIGQSILDGSTAIRTDPPPTAVLVPLAMVVAAAASGFAVSRLRRSPRSAPQSAEFGTR